MHYLTWRDAQNLDKNASLCSEVIISWIESKWRKHCKAYPLTCWWFTFLSLYCTWRQEAFPLLARIEYILKHGVGECCKWGAQLSSLPQWVFWGQFGTRSRQLTWEKLYRILSCPPRDPGWSNSTKICCILAENIPKDMITFDQGATMHSWRTRRSKGNRSQIKQRESI